MAYFLTAADLKADALDLAGEPASGSQYDSDAYAWLTLTERALVSGGAFGPSLLEPLDWTWARAWPRGVIQLTQPVNQDQTVDATFVTGSQDVLIADNFDLVGFRIMRTDVAARHTIVAQSIVNTTSMVAHLQSPWTGPSDTTDAWMAYPDTYTLPTDFARGCSPLFVAGIDTLVGSGTIDVIDPVLLERMYPWQTVRGGLPEAAARVTDTRLRFSHFLDSPEVPRSVQVEFEYIRQPPVLAEGSIPLVPEPFRRALSYGAAYLILDDKDDSSAGSLFQRFEATWKAMRDAEVRSAMRMSMRWGVVQPARADGSGPRWWTESGLPVYAW